jgi:hypothetical protein
MVDIYQAHFDRWSRDIQPMRSSAARDLLCFFQRLIQLGDGRIEAVVNPNRGMS